MTPEQSSLCTVIAVCVTICFCCYFTREQNTEWAKAFQEWGKGMAADQVMPGTVCKEKK